MSSPEFASLPCSGCVARRGSLCGALADPDLHRLYALATDRRCAAGEFIFRQEDRADHVYSLRAGHATLVRLTDDGRRQILSFLFPGDFLGLTSEDTYHYAAAAITPVEACRFERAALEDLSAGFPAMDRKLRYTLTRAMDASFELLFSLGRKDALQKVASFLWYVHYRQRKLGQPDSVFQLPMRRADIADFLGLTTETVSRAFTLLRQQGVIRLHGTSGVEIADLGALRAVGVVVAEPAPFVHADPDYYPRKGR